MSNILNTLSVIGALTMAATPLVAIGSAAHAAEFQPQRVMVADLDLSRRADAATFRARVSDVAEHMCAGSVDRSGRADCSTAVQDEAVQGLGSAQRQDLGAAEGGRSAWRVASR